MPPLKGTGHSAQGTGQTMPAVWARLLLAICCTLLLVSCNYVITQPVLGYEANDLDCSDEIDNDGDGAVDCADPECWPNSTLCGEFVPTFQDDLPAENSFALCTDLIDNDGDGTFDCDERSCRAINETCCALEFDDVSCDDGIDNDANGFADCDDFSCRSGKFVTVCSEDTARTCDDNKDNDEDGDIDCEEASCATTAPCAPPQGPENQITPDPDGTDCTSDDDCPRDFPDCILGACAHDNCRDEGTNDGNRFVDCNDRQCTDPGLGATPEQIEYCSTFQQETTADLCTNGEDDDLDGFADCDDFSCIDPQFGATPESIDACDAEPVEEQEESLRDCRDGEDNDEDGFADCEDFSCQDSLDPDTVEHCNEVLENTFDKCKDGIDNDGNGFIDCEDFSCLAADAPDVAVACQESLDPANCDNDIDDDLDGFVDCKDWDCTWNPAVTACQDKPRVCE